MIATEHTKLTLADLLNAANKYYDDSYLSTYFDPVSGDSRSGSGDLLAKLIASELRDTFDDQSSRDLQIAAAIRVLQNLREDIQNAIDGLHDL